MSNFDYTGATTGDPRIAGIHCPSIARDDRPRPADDESGGTDGDERADHLDERARDDDGGIGETERRRADDG